MDWTQAVDIYCERTTARFWAEPVNALTNAGFVLAAAWGAVEARRRALTQPVLWLLVALAGAIGVGSFLFHTYANGWSALADTGPIWLFVAVYILAAMRWIGGMAPRRVAWVSGFFVAAGALIAVLASSEGAAPKAAAPDPLNGSGQYAPALIALLVFSVIVGLRRHPYRHWLWGATGAFVVSLAFRTLDRDICASFPLGTHFIWHLMNAAMIAALLQLMIRVMGDARVAPAG